MGIHQIPNSLCKTAGPPDPILLNIGFGEGLGFYLGCGAILNKFPIETICSGDWGRVGTRTIRNEDN